MATAKQILDIARAELGTKEKPAGSNNVKYNTDYYGSPVSGSEFPWCCAFVYWVFKQAGALDLFAGGAKTAWCPYAMHWYENSGVFNSDTSQFKPGDVIFFNFQGGQTPGHIGIVESVDADGNVICIEGNTSITSNDNGGCVMRRTRTENVILGAGRPNYEESEDEDMVRYEKVKNIPEENNFRAIIDDLMTAKVIGGDGGDPVGNDDVIDLSHDMVRMFVFMYRGGLYDDELAAAGIDPDKYKTA